MDELVAAVVRGSERGGRLFVAIDGIGAAGKTTYAQRLARALHPGLHAVVLHEDDFFNDSVKRRARGRFSAEGFWLDAYNISALQRDALNPLRDGESTYRHASFDRARGRAYRPLASSAPAQAVVVVEGAFLLRDELAPYWDLSVFLDVPFAVAEDRMRERADSAWDRNLLRRYLGAQRLYFLAAEPWRRASFVIDNADPHEPRLIAPERSSAAREAQRTSAMP